MFPAAFWWQVKRGPAIFIAEQQMAFPGNQAVFLQSFIFINAPRLLLARTQEILY